MTTPRSCKRIWPNFLSQFGYTIAETLVSWSLYPECPARELQQFNQVSVNSHLSHTSTTFTGRQDWELKQNKPSPNCNKTLIQNPLFSKGVQPSHGANPKTSQEPFIRKAPLQHKGLTVLIHKTPSEGPGMHLSFCLPVCVHYGLGLFPQRADEQTWHLPWWIRRKSCKAQVTVSIQIKRVSWISSMFKFPRL